MFKDEPRIIEVSERASVRMWLRAPAPETHLYGSLAQRQGDPGDKCCLHRSGKTNKMFKN